MTDSPATVASTLVADTIVGGSTGWTTRVGAMPTAPDQIVLFVDSGGFNPDPRWRLDYPTIQVRVRGVADDYPTAYSKIREVRDALLGIMSQDVGSDRWDSVIVLGDIAFIGSDNNNRPQFSVNFRTIIEPSTGTNRDPL